MCEYDVGYRTYDMHVQLKKDAAEEDGSSWIVLCRFMYLYCLGEMDERQWRFEGWSFDAFLHVGHEQEVGVYPRVVGHDKSLVWCEYAAVRMQT
jgi:hypothetical protein